MVNVVLVRSMFDPFFNWRCFMLSTFWLVCLAFVAAITCLVVATVKTERSKTDSAVKISAIPFFGSIMVMLICAYAFYNWRVGEVGTPYNLNVDTYRLLSQTCDESGKFNFVIVQATDGTFHCVWVAESFDSETKFVKLVRKKENQWELKAVKPYSAVIIPNPLAEAPKKEPKKPE